MITPAGSECKFYYQDFYRGRSIQECRLLKANPQSNDWQPALCRRCPVPGILRANACPNMTLTARVGRRRLFWPQVQVQAFCSLAGETVAEPHIGCGRCHEARKKALNL